MSPFLNFDGLCEPGLLKSAFPCAYHIQVLVVSDLSMSRLIVILLISLGSFYLSLKESTFEILQNVCMHSYSQA